MKRLSILVAIVALMCVTTELQAEALSAQEIMQIHSEAISLGETEYVKNSLAYDPDFQAGGYYGDLSNDEKARAALNDFNDIFSAFLKGDAQDLESITRIAKYSPIFSTDYLLRFEGDFPTEELAGAIKIVELDKQSAELDKQSAELDKQSAELDIKIAQSQAELAQAQEKLREAFGKLAETMKSKGMGSE
jgi:uncharacterized coiled-coil protein SlyX